MYHSVHNCHYSFIYVNYEPTRKINNDDLPSSVLFEWLAPFNTVFKAKNAQEFFGINRAVYGVTQTIDKKYDFELYYYFPNIFSKHKLDNILKFLNTRLPVTFNKRSDQFMVGFKVNSNNSNHNIAVYYPDISCSELHAPYIICNYYGYLFCEKCKACFKETPYNSVEKNHYKYFYSAETTHNDIDLYIKSSTKQLWGTVCSINDIIPDFIKQFECLSTCISLKPDNTLGVYISQIKVDDLILFLKAFDYSTEFINKIENKMNSIDHLLFDVGYNIKLNNDKTLIINRTGFYGIL